MAKQGDEARREVATACRILGAAIGSTGHVSSRIDDREMYLRCRGSNEAGLAYADTPSVRRMDFDGKGPLIGAYRTPHETPLHGEVYKLRPDANAVVHVHPYHAVLCGLAGVEFRPIFGGYAGWSVQVTQHGVPLYDRVTQTITTSELAREMCDAMGDRDLVLLRGHGMVTVGKTVEAATVLAIRFERLAETVWQLVLSGRYDQVPNVPEEDILRYGPDRIGGPAQSPAASGAEEGGGWRQYLRALEAGVGMPSSVRGDE